MSADDKKKHEKANELEGDERKSVPPEHHYEMAAAAAATGTAAGAIVGSIAGPPGAIAGAAIGAAIGGAAGHVLDTEDERSTARDHELDDEIGITEGSMGLPKGTPRTAEEAATRRASQTPPPPAKAKSESTDKKG